MNSIADVTEPGRDWFGVDFFDTAKEKQIVSKSEKAVKVEYWNG